MSLHLGIAVSVSYSLDDLRPPFPLKATGYVFILKVQSQHISQHLRATSVSCFPLLSFSPSIVDRDIRCNIPAAPFEKVVRFQARFAPALVTVLPAFSAPRHLPRERTASFSLVAKQSIAP